MKLNRCSWLSLSNHRGWQAHRGENSGIQLAVGDHGQPKNGADGNDVDVFLPQMQLQVALYVKM